MWCDRCAERDRSSLGTDEHDYPAEGVLCQSCITDLDEARAEAEAESDYEQRVADYYGSSAPQTDAERWQVAHRAKREG